MKVIIERWGNSAGLPLSKALRRHLYADIGDKVDVQINGECLLIHAVQAPQYTLEELLSTCTRQNTVLDAEDKAWLGHRLAGKEV